MLVDGVRVRVTSITTKATVELEESKGDCGSISSNISGYLGGPTTSAGGRTEINSGDFKSDSQW
jgi:hypothetical protein